MTKWNRLLLVALVLAVGLQWIPSGIVLAGKYDSTLQESPNVRHVTGFYPSIKIDDFNTPDSVDAPGKWSKGEGVSEVRYTAKTANSPGSPYEGTHVLEAVSGQVKAYEWRTMYKEFSVPLDLSSVKYLTFAANAYGWKTEDYLIRVSLYNGDDKFQSIVKINPNGWNEVGVSVADWANRNRITKIEFSFMLNYDLAGLRDGDPGYAWWGGNYQIDLLSGSNTLDMDFNTEGETEGFTAQGASASAAGGELNLTVTDTAPVLVSPPLLHNIGSLNTLEVSMSNNSAFDRVRIDWITEESPEWNEAKSAVFDIQPNSSGYADYDFNLSANSLWTGLLKQFKLTFLSSNGASSGQIGIDKIGFKNLAPIVVYPGEISRHELTGSLDKIVIAGSIKPEALTKYGSGSLAFFELQPYEDEKALTGKTPLSEASVSANFSFETDLKDTNGRSRLFSKFAVAARLADGSYELIDRAHYVTNPEALAPNRYPFPTAASKRVCRCR
ncbi:hypothetical protein N6H14_20875 [Paenibacillus sp. CC-CFT747]|nr:hypothetical protein N6H14_20875 [Paenibacillus sp. CC-CFT747]